MVEKKLNVIVAGATGAVGEAMLDILHQRKFPVGKVYALASERSAGSLVDFGNKSLIDVRKCVCLLSNSTTRFIKS